MVQEIHEMQQNTSTNPSNIYDQASVEGQSQKRKKKYMKCSRKSPHIHSSLFFILLVQREKGVAMRNGHREVAKKRPIHTQSPLGNP